MACGIPFDLDRAWFLSDVVLLAENAEGCELHVSRALLSSSSPVFKTMFSSSFEESSQDRISISSDYEALKEVLRLLYHSSCKCPTTKMDGEMLFSMYTVADKWDLPIVRKRVFGMVKVISYHTYEQILEMYGEQDGKVPCAIPEYLSSPWFYSDAEVISRDGRRFYVSKALLFSNSFFHNQFIDLKKSSVEVPIHSSVLQEILHRMHHINCKCSHKIRDEEVSVQLHLANSWMEIPKINVIRLPPLDAFIKVLDKETDCTIRLEQKRALISICQNLNKKDLQSFFASDDPRPIFSKEDLAALCKITPRSEKCSEIVNLQLESEAKRWMVPVNFSKPSGLFNLMIKTRNSQGASLYAKKEVFVKYSEFFKKKFLEPEWSEGKTPEGYDVITVDEEYSVLHRIVAVVHGCHNAISSVLSAPYIHALYQLASEEKLDVPLVRKLCLDAVTKVALYNEKLSYLELAIKLKLDEEIKRMVEEMSAGRLELRKWLEGSFAIQSYVNDGQEFVFDVNKDEPLFTAKDVHNICHNLMRFTSLYNRK